MKVLIIPDVHLKPFMFDRAAQIINSDDSIDLAVCLGDLVDDWGQQRNIRLYEDTFAAASKFADEFPLTLWCYGNHDKSYQFRFSESGYSKLAEPVVRQKLMLFENKVNDKIQYVHRIDNVIFSHAGLSRGFVENALDTVNSYRNIDYVVNTINYYVSREMLWTDTSPLWFRPQMQTNIKTFYPKKLLQVVGHTPVKEPYIQNGILSCDTFSTYSNGEPYGNEVFVVLDIETWDTWWVNK